jgi:signal transduction histidine kinase
MVDITKEQNSNGTGLGLYISHNISKKLGFDDGDGI